MSESAPLRSLVLASRKGGAGKTTLALHLGVILGDRSKVLLVDADEQASASAWYRMRTAEHPRLVACGRRQVRDVLSVAADEGIELAIIDTAGKAEVETMMRLADFVLVPVKTAFLDLDAVARTVQSVHELGKPGAIVLNGAPPPRGAGEASLTTAARIALTAYRSLRLPSSTARSLRPRSPSGRSQPNKNLAARRPSKFACSRITWRKSCVPQTQL